MPASNIGRLESAIRMGGLALAVLSETQSSDGRTRHHHSHHHHHHLPHGLVTFPKSVSRWVEPWFLSYTCLGIVQGGMLPLVLPLSAGSASHAGIIVGVMNFAGLTAPYWGHLADRRRLHRQVLLVGMLVILFPLLLLPVKLGFAIKVVLACMLGLGFAAANTVANMFIVEVRPQEEWDSRIGALQALCGVGQVGGLLLAGVLGGRYGLAYGVAAALTAAAVPIAWLTLRGVHVEVPRSAATAHPPTGGEGWASSPQRLFHLPTWSGMAKLIREMETPFAFLQFIWFLAFVAIGAVLTMFPLAVVEKFAASPGLPATTYAFASVISLGFFPVAASLAKQYGETSILGAGFLVRAIAMAFLGTAFFSPYGEIIAPVSVGVLVVAWPLLGVSGTALSAQLAPHDKGEALGLFNASTSLASAIGALLGGWAMQKVGFGMLCTAGSIIVGFSAVSSLLLRARTSQIALPALTGNMDPAEQSGQSNDDSR
jgi:MFS family permease